MVDFLKSQFFVCMILVSVLLHAGAAWVSSVKIQPPRMIPTQGGVASISLRSSVAAGPRASRGGPRMTEASFPDSLAALPPPAGLKTPFPAPPEPSPPRPARHEVAPPALARAEPLPALKAETRANDLPNLPVPDLIPDNPAPSGDTPATPNQAKVLPRRSARPVDRKARASTALPSLKAEDRTPAPPEIPDLPPLRPVPSGQGKTPGPDSPASGPESAAKGQTGRSYHSPPPGMEAKGKESGPKLEAVTVISDVVSLPSPGSRGSRGSQVDALPQGLATNPSPPYPPAELAAGVEGRVVLWVKIDAAGNVAHVHVHRSSNVDAFDRSALGTVRQWVFEPARRGDEPVPFEVLVPIEFKIDRNR